MPPDKGHVSEYRKRSRRIVSSLCLFALLAPFLACPVRAREDSSAAAQGASSIDSFVDEYCDSCHGSRRPKADLDLASLTGQDILRQDIVAESRVWEGVIRKLSARQMPPVGEDSPSDAEYDAVVAELERVLDAAAAESPRPGRTETFRRLTRTEYRHAIRDLLALDVDVSALLPADSSSHGFDNVTVGDLSPTLLERYVAAAQHISRLAVGGAMGSPVGETIRVPGDRTQEGHVEGLPLGTRGGLVLPYTFPLDGEYDIAIRLTRDRDEHVEGLRESHELDLLVDRRRVAAFRVRPPPDGNHSQVDAHLRVRVPVRAGPRQLGVTFVERGVSLLESRRQPYQARFNRHRHPRRTPAVFQVSITGPFAATGPGETPSRDRIFASAPREGADEADRARHVLRPILRRAYRRPVSREALARSLRFFEQGRVTAEPGDPSSFEAGIQVAIASILVHPRFLFRIEEQPDGLDVGEVYRVGAYELATRLAFFLWSSLPDDELLDAAERGDLLKPDGLRLQVDRLLADARSEALVDNFAAQWLHLRSLGATSPDQRLFPDFDDNLRQSFRRETESFVESIFRSDRSVLELLSADYTFLDERLARHYGIDHVEGSRFRRVDLGTESQRGGLLRQGSVLSVTSYATRTSLVLRGQWILENLIGAPLPPPPPGVPTLEENRVSADLPLRERFLAHRANPVCAGCHDLLDPVGFALEGFDAVGRHRTLDSGQPVDTRGELPGFGAFTGAAGLEQALLRRPELFVRTLVEKLLTFALGRGVEHFDAPAVRRVVRAARKEDWRFSALVHEIVQSAPFLMRTAR